MANCEAKWVLDPKPVVVEFATSDREDEIIIIQPEGLPEQDEIKINDEVFNVSGVMRVDKDGRIFAVRGGQRDPTDLSCRFNQYQLNIPNADRTHVQPKTILLESQYLRHHFVHWQLPNEVKCTLTQYTGDGEPPININSPADQQFVWVIPTDPESSQQLALQTYGKQYYLIFGSDLRAMLHVGDPSKNARFRIDPVPAL